MTNSRAVLLLLIANAISGVSQGITMLAVPWYFTGILHEEGLFGGIYLTVTFISLFWGIYSGTLIDRYDRKLIFLGMNTAGFVVLSGVSLYGMLHEQMSWWAAALPFAATAFIYNIHFPNLYAYAQEITPKEDYAKVTSLLEIQGQISFTLAGGIAAVLLHGMSGQDEIFAFPFLPSVSLPSIEIWHIFALDALTYAAAFFIIYRIRSLAVVQKNIDTAPLRQRLVTGFIYLRQHPLIFRFGVFSLMLFLTILVFGTQISPMFVKLHLRAGGNVFAISDMAFSFGALLAGVIVGKAVKGTQTVPRIIQMHLLAGCMYLVMLLTFYPLIFFIANFIIGFCNAGVRIMRVTHLFQHVPNHVIGRTGSVFFVINVLCRLILIGLFSFSFFHKPRMVLIPVALLALICFVAALALWRDHRYEVQHNLG
ncbi:MAG: MFS transporter [Chitinophagales bacterium]|nr:MFS transporter [Chitinophagales bacterium]MDW8273559.1 MFS transporter [Chitinophagales bacterium]